MSEVEEYERVDLGTLAGATLHGPAVSDVAHLVAELLENATQFSPPETMVRVDGARTGGSYQLVITDQGVGMRPEQLEELNAVLRDPPVTGLALGRSLGCLVAARLAARHGITVRLRAGEGEGVAAYVVLPAPPPGGGAGRAAPVRRARRPPHAGRVPAVADAAYPERLEEALPRDRLRRQPPGPPRRRATDGRTGRARAVEAAPAPGAAGVDPHAPRPGRHHRGPARAARSSRPCAAAPTRCAPCCPATAPAWRPDARTDGPPDEERA